MADQDGFETAPLVSSDEEFLDAAPETPNGLVPGSLAVRYEPELSQISMPIMSEAFMGDEVEEQGLLAATDDSDDENTEFRVSTFTVEQAVDNMGCGLFQAKFFFICGLFSATDALEMLLLAVLSPVLRCEWFLEDYQVAFLTTVVFLGMFGGSFFWGGMADKYGRFPIVYMNAIFILYYGILTTFSPDFEWVLFLRMMVGFSFGGALQNFTLFSEYIPSKYRAKILILTNFSWAIGSTFEIILAKYTVPTLGWRYLVGLSALPSFISIFALWFLPESARYMMACGKKEEARLILQQASIQNNTTLPPGELVQSKLSHQGQFKDLLNPKYRCTTLLLWVLWFGAAYSYYGVLLLSSEILESATYCGAESKTDSGLPHENCHCKLLNDDDYKSMVISTFGEFLAIPVNIVTVDTLGRRLTLCLDYGMAGLGFLLLNICTSRTGTTVFLFLIRASVSGVFNIVYIYTSEVYPTTVRSLGLGTCSGMARLGSMVTPFFAQVLLRKTTRGALWIYGVFCLFAAAVAMAMPIETKGREMPQTIHCDADKKTKPAR